ncbi:MAG: T9SS type A sorting domain-containing protein [Bacteroidia bacterium]
MKKSLLLLAACIGFGASVMAQDANLSLGNLSSYYDTYDTSTKTISGIVLVVGADGSNSNNYITSEFETSLYLLPCDISGNVTGNTPIIISVYMLPGNTLHQMGTYTWSNQSVDLTQVWGLADGLYRMGAWVNSNASNHGIADPPDDQSDNAGLLQSSGGSSSSSVINFRTGSSGIKTNENGYACNLYPNPFKTTLNIEMNTANEYTVVLYDMAGKAVQTDSFAQKTVITRNNLSAGMYFAKIFDRNNKMILAKKISVID